MNFFANGQVRRTADSMRKVARERLDKAGENAKEFAQGSHRPRGTS